MAQRLVEEPQLWSGLVAPDPRRRAYEELVRNEHLTAWVICWMEDHDTGFHDHDASAGAVAVARGRLREERLRPGGGIERRTYAAGQSFHFAPADIHRVRHDGDEPAVSLHLYSPPLDLMGAYVVQGDGSLRRETISYAEELRPLERS